LKTRILYPYFYNLWYLISSQAPYLYQEFAQEDRELAEAGMSEYTDLLNSEDKDESRTW
jgi:hypothetical protein